jgi:uncharacterized membrane protein YgcG
MTRVRSNTRKLPRSAALLATASLLALLAGAPEAAAQDCAGQAAPPANLATPSMLYETLSTRTNAQLLAIGFLRKTVAQDCAWIYEVRMLTASGSVVELDFDAAGLDLIGARGPEDDHAAADLVRTLGGDAAVLNAGAARVGSRGKDGEGAGSDEGSGQGSGGSGGHGRDDAGDGGEGGNSGSGGGGGSDDGGGEGGDGGGGEGGDGGDDGGEGGEGGDD